MKKFLYTFIFTFILAGSSMLMAQSQTNLDKGLRFVEQNAQKWGLVESDYADIMVSDMYSNHKTGVTYIYLIQAYKGIPVNNAITPVIISSEGRISVVKHGFVQGLETKVNGTKPSLTPVAAIKSSVAHLGLVAKDMPALLRSDVDKNIFDFGVADFAHNEISVKLTYVLENNQLRLAWNLAIDEKQDSDYYSVFVDASNGQVISKFNYTKSCTFHKDQYSKHKGCDHAHDNKEPMATLAEANAAMTAASGSYSVYALPTESPIHGPLVSVTSPHFTDSSPFGWHDTNYSDGPEFTITRGNNVHAFLDKDDTSISSGDEPDGGDALDFSSYSHVALGQALDNQDASTVNLFYTANMVHDITERLGFDEQAGNFQQNNNGVGGLGGDYVLAKASAGFGLPGPLLNNADFSTPPDGSNGRMRMFLWNNPSGILSVDSPPALAGFIGDIIEARDPATGLITWGTEVPGPQDTPVTGKVVIAVEDSPGNPITACNPILNADEVNGNIALVDRGLCDFSMKAYNAQIAGAISVIICNVDGGSALGGMGPGDNNELVTIIPLLIPKADCDRIKASILSNIDVTLTLQSRDPMGPTYLDGSVDNGIIAHEYGHGISNRLTGGPGAAGCVSSAEQAGEGISDFFSLVLTVEEGDQGTDSRGIGNYADAQPANGGGIRGFPYSTDMSVNPRTYDDIKVAGGVHEFGETWATALWEIYWGFVNRDGLDMKWEDEDAGNYKAVRLVIEGMKMGPCNPSLIDARDAILQADTMFYSGSNAELLWTAFAKRGFGYLADDGAGSDDATDGTENFDPYPQAIQTMKIQQVNETIAEPGDELTVTITAQNHIPDTQTDVVITSNIPAGLTYVDGSSSMTATHENGVLSIPVGDMVFDQNITITYNVTADAGVSSETLFIDDLEEEDDEGYITDVIEGDVIWNFAYPTANSGSISWWASQPNIDEEIDYWLNIPPLQVVGNTPALRFFHKYDTEFGADAGFVRVSTDGGVVFQDVKDKWIRNGYNSSVQYGTFAIPLLEGFSGSTDDQFIDSYLDLTDFKGEEIIVRFRFGTDDNTGPDVPERGWFLDDFEMMDLIRYEAITCIASSNTSGEQCATPVQIIIDSDGVVGLNDDELEGFNIGISPNPASDYITVGLTAEVKTPVQILLTNIDGKVVSAQNAVAKPSAIARTFDTSSLQAGMYLVQIKSATGITTKKVIIQ
ncbi:MAG: extracellular elastinolytic metalloproteinase [Saprospiraceae bacterium]|jgi:extracellular elastinolytic metalloproteinase